MNEPFQSYAEWMNAWNRLWQTGFQTIWHGYTQWFQAFQAYSQGQQLVGQTPAGELWRSGRVRLIRYHPTTPRQHPIPVLCVPSLINRYYILDLMPDRSLVSYLVSHGLDVYLLDWGRPTPGDAGDTLDQHITGYLQQAVKLVQQASQATQVSLLGYCMGGMFTAVYATLFPPDVANLVNLAGPINYHDDGIFSTFTRADWFDADKLVDTYGNIPADLLAWTFQMIRPTSHLLRALYLYERLEDGDYVRSFAAMQTWIFDQVDFPGEAFRHYVKALYQENQLVEGRFAVGSRPVHLANIHAPLLTIASQHDETAPYASVAILDQLAGSQDKTLLSLRGPHVGMVAGHSAPKYLWPPLANWLAERSGPLP